MSPYFANPVYFIVSTLVSLYVIALLLRFWLQLSKADFYHPFSQAIVKITDPLCSPLRKFLPSLAGQDTASLVTAILVKFLFIYAVITLSNGTALWWQILLAAAGSLWSTLLVLLWFGIIIYAISSWFALGGGNPLLSLLEQILHPMVAPFRQWVPPVGGALDLSPLFAIIAIEVVRMLTVPAIESVLPAILIGLM